MPRDVSLSDSWTVNLCRNSSLEIFKITLLHEFKYLNHHNIYATVHQQNSYTQNYILPLWAGGRVCPPFPSPLFNPFLPTVAFNICCPRDAVSRTANFERNGGHKWVNLYSIGWRDRDAGPKCCHYSQISHAQSPLNRFCTWCNMMLSGLYPRKINNSSVHLPRLHRSPVVNIPLLPPLTCRRVRGNHHHIAIHIYDYIQRICFSNTLTISKACIARSSSYLT